MIKVQHKNGIISEYDETFKEGDLIFAYQKGYHVFIAYEEREGNTPIVLHRRVFSENGKKASSSILKCDASYCGRAKVYLKQEIEKRQKEIKALESILEDPNYYPTSPK